MNILDATGLEAARMTKVKFYKIFEITKLQK